jgi:hypothetical protein
LSSQFLLNSWYSIIWACSTSSRSLVWLKINSSRLR